MEEKIICPRCKECELEKHETGLLEIYFLNDVLCLSLNELKNKIGMKEQATRQFEFHYIKCPKCDYIKFYEYREVETWDSKKHYLNKPFREGDVTYDWRYGANRDKYIGYKVIHW